MVHTPFAGFSDLGRKRARNDDRWGADPALGLYVVADGVGSTSHGDLAAALVVEMLPGYVARDLADMDLRDAQATERLGRAMVEMCNELYARSRTESLLASADTTVVAAVISNSRAVIAHLGDSRAYLYRDRQVDRLTSDHTVVQAVMDAGELTAEQAAHHPSRSVVTRHVLMAPPANPDVRALDLRPGDRILLCSDGLHGLVDDATLAAILTDYPDPAAACQTLIDAANHAGGPDNITAVVVNADQLPPRLPPPPGPTASDLRSAAPNPPGRSPRSSLGRGPLLLLLAMVVVLLTAAVIAGYLLWPRQPASQVPAAVTTTPSVHAMRPTTTSGPSVLPYAGLNHPEGVAADRDGNVYVVANEGDSARVWKLAVGASDPSALPFPGLKGASGVAVDRLGNVYVADSYEGGRVLELPIGFSTPITLPFDKTTYGFGLAHPSGLAVDTAGHVYVADKANDRVVELAVNSGGQVALPFAGLDHPSDVAVDSLGDVYVADTDRNRVVMLAPGSTTQVVLPFAGLDRPGGVAADATGNIYVTDSGNHRVVKLAAGNQNVLPFTDLGNPTGVAVDTAGNVYVADYDNNHLVKLPAG
jgi:serine/threonine protein phosphatase PrpC/DNA-binding beta-propeller fold protein YncE